MGEVPGGQRLYVCTARVIRMYEEFQVSVSVRVLSLCAQCVRYIYEEDKVGVDAQKGMDCGEEVFEYGIA